MIYDDDKIEEQQLKFLALVAESLGGGSSKNTVTRHNTKEW